MPKIDATLRSVILVGALTCATPVCAHDYTAGSLKIDHPWSRATPGGAKVAAGYLGITNTGSEPDRLLGGSLEGAAAGEVHTMSIEGGVMRMKPVEGGLTIKPGETIKLEPSGLHLMFLDLKVPLKKGDSVKGALTFERAGRVAVEFKVEGIAAKSGADGHQDHEHHH